MKQWQMQQPSFEYFHLWKNNVLKVKDRIYSFKKKKKRKHVELKSDVVGKSWTCYSLFSILRFLNEKHLDTDALPISLHLSGGSKYCSSDL